MRIILAATTLVLAAACGGGPEFDEDGLRAFLADTYPEADADDAVRMVRDICDDDENVFAAFIAVADPENLELVEAGCPDRVRTGR